MGQDCWALSRRIDNAVMEVVMGCTEGAHTRSPSQYREQPLQLHAFDEVCTPNTEKFYMQVIFALSHNLLAQ